jgi:hypothetical protein
MDVSRARALAVNGHIAAPLAGSLGPDYSRSKQGGPSKLKPSLAPFARAEGLIDERGMSSRILRAFHHAKNRLKGGKMPAQGNALGQPIEGGYQP